MPREKGPSIMPFDQKEGLNKETTHEKQASKTPVTLQEKVTQILKEKPELQGASLDQVMEAMGMRFDFDKLTTEMEEIATLFRNNYVYDTKTDPETKQTSIIGLKPTYDKDNGAFSEKVATEPSRNDIRNTIKLQKKVRAIRDKALMLLDIARSIVQYHEAHDIAVHPDVDKDQDDYEHVSQEYIFYTNSLNALTRELSEKRLKYFTDGGFFLEKTEELFEYFRNLSDSEEEDAPEFKTKEIPKILETAQEKIKTGVQALEDIFSKKQDKTTPQTESLSKIFTSKKPTDKKPEKPEIPDIQRLAKEDPTQKMLLKTFADIKSLREKSLEISNLLEIVTGFYTILGQINSLENEITQIQGSKNPKQRKSVEKFLKENSSKIANLRIIKTEILKILNELTPYLIVLESTNLLRRSKATTPTFTKTGSYWEKINNFTETEFVTEKVHGSKQKSYAVTYEEETDEDGKLRRKTIKM